MLGSRFAEVHSSMDFGAARLGKDTHTEVPVFFPPGDIFPPRSRRHFLVDLVHECNLHAPVPCVACALLVSHTGAKLHVVPAGGQRRNASNSHLPRVHVTYLVSASQEGYRSMGRRSWAVGRASRKVGASDVGLPASRASCAIKHVVDHDVARHFTL